MEDANFPATLQSTPRSRYEGKAPPLPDRLAASYFVFPQGTNSSSDQLLRVIDTESSPLLVSFGGSPFKNVMHVESSRSP